MSIRTGLTCLILGLALLTPGAAFAHVGHGDSFGLMAGFTHPTGGYDHVLAMVAVGMLAANLGGRALWATPLTFVLAMGLGGALGIAGATAPFVETGIALSVIVFGLAVALQVKLPTILAIALAAVFAIFHGHAHGGEMPADAQGAAYAAGFMIATAMLHVVGIAIGLGVAKMSELRSARALQVSGAGIAIAGVAILGGAL